MIERFYAGIGSRETPFMVLNLMTGLAQTFLRAGLTLRSGGAAGADRAFEDGAEDKKQIFLASDVDQAALDLAAKFHPAWGRCSPYAKLLHARNGYQVLGRDLKTPSEFVCCWTKDGGPTGGTGQALRIAAAYHIPIFNLHDQRAKYSVMERLEGIFG